MQKAIVYILVKVETIGQKLLLKATMKVRIWKNKNEIDPEEMRIATVK
jgi:hypothetical protein